MALTQSSPAGIVHCTPRVPPSSDLSRCQATTVCMESWRLGDGEWLFARLIHHTDHARRSTTHSTPPHSPTRPISTCWYVSKALGELRSFGESSIFDWSNVNSPFRYAPGLLHRLGLAFMTRTCENPRRRCRPRRRPRPLGVVVRVHGRAIVLAGHRLRR